MRKKMTLDPSIKMPVRGCLDLGWWEDIVRALHKNPNDYNIECYAPQHGYDPCGDGVIPLALYNAGDYHFVPLFPKPAQGLAPRL